MWWTRAAIPTMFWTRRIQCLRRPYPRRIPPRCRPRRVPPRWSRRCRPRRSPQDHLPIHQQTVQATLRPCRHPRASSPRQYHRRLPPPRSSPPFRRPALHPSRLHTYPHTSPPRRPPPPPCPPWRPFPMPAPTASTSDTLPGRTCRTRPGRSLSSSTTMRPRGPRKGPIPLRTPTGPPSIGSTATRPANSGTTSTRGTAGRTTSSRTAGSIWGCRTCR
mmetsp:Transcript_13351/g.28888  ORF Transcript_13351/g.28888 Transcript_13351/m.28888 type:complete len:218 (+) Transcript_13351:573-1226(+)